MIMEMKMKVLLDLLDYVILVGSFFIAACPILVPIYLISVKVVEKMKIMDLPSDRSISTCQLLVLLCNHLLHVKLQQFNATIATRCVDRILIMRAQTLNLLFIIKSYFCSLLFLLIFMLISM